MKIRDDGIIIHNSVFKENFNIITVFTKSNGMYRAVVKNYSKKDRLIYQVGNLVDFSWHARLHEHIGHAKCELNRSFVGYIISQKIKLLAFNSIISIMLIAFCEREPHNNFFPIFENYLLSILSTFNFNKYIQLELGILAETGFALNLDSCVVTGQKHDLFYLSPKSGKAVSKNAGRNYHDKLLVLPQFLLKKFCDKENFLFEEISYEDKINALKITEYFFKRYLLNYESIGAREQFVAALKPKLYN